MTDVTIIGAGIGGMTTAIVSSYEGLSVRLIDKNGFKMPQNKSSHFFSLPVLGSYTPESLYEVWVRDISNCGIELTRDKAVSIFKEGDIFKVCGEIGYYFSYSVIIAAGKDHGISFPAAGLHCHVDESCRASPSGLMLCGNARREAGLLRCMADGMVCGETAAEWVKSNFYT